MTSPDGSDPRTLTGVQENPYDNEVALSPDGTRLAWLSPTGTSWDSTRELWVSLLSGDPGRRIGPAAYPTGLMWHPSWSPDGRSVAVSLHGDYRTAIYVIDVESGEGRVVGAPRSRERHGRDVVAGQSEHRLPGRPGRGPAPSGDPETTQAPAMDLFVVAVDGSGERNVTHSPEEEFAPHWSPDGRRLAYLTDFATLGIVDTVTWQPSGQAIAAAMDGFTWSPDGTRIVSYSVAAIDLPQGPDGSSRQDIKTTIRSIPLDDSTPRLVTVPGHSSCDPSWQALSGDGPASGDSTDAARSP